MSWDDAPPSQEDLGSSKSWDSLPPSAHDLKGRDPTSQLESGARGVAQGLSFGFADELTGGAEALWKAAKGDPKTFGELYRQSRDESRNNYRNAKDDNPYTYGAGQIAGAVAPALASGGSSLLGTGVADLTLQGAAQGLGSSDADITQGDIGDAAEDTAKGAALGLLMGSGGKALSKIPGAAKDLAENWAVKATGATGRQAEKFAPNAGRELLDRGLVKFGDSPANIATRVGDAADDAGQAIGDALKTLDDKGVTASVKNVVDTLENKVKDLSAVPGNEKTINQIQNQIENLKARGEESLPISSAEQAKRNYQSEVNYFSPEFEKKGASHVANAFRNEVESAATGADPALADKFMNEKKTFGLLAPIREAAEKRASTLSQSPIGGLLDTTTGGLAGIAHGTSPLGIGAAAAAGRRILAPRIASSGAALADVVSKSPQVLGKYGPVLSQAMQRGGNSLGVTDFLLQQNDPNYREMKKQWDQDE
jgi:hypothetical protein